MCIRVSGIENMEHNCEPFEACVSESSLNPSLQAASRTFWKPKTLERTISLS